MRKVSMRVLITGGAGFIGSHTCVELLRAAWDILVVDDLRNSKIESLHRVREIAGVEPNTSRLQFRQIDLLDGNRLTAALVEFRPDAVIHFAGLKAVGESVQNPLAYFHNNLTGTLNLLFAMQAANCKNLVFSSSATVYGNPDSVPIREDQPLSTASPYGRTKLFIEEILRDLANADAAWHIAALRYFNPAGADPSGKIGEDPQGIPNNLMPYITQVAIGKLPSLAVFGGDYPTPDGTCVRDYIHVSDLAVGHRAALEKLPEISGWRAFNLGTGRGSSVLEVIAAFESATGKKIPYQIAARRAGDVTQCYAEVSRAKNELGWSAKKSLIEMCADAWAWQTQNPRGY